MLRLKGYIITLCVCYVIDFLLNMTLSLCGVYGFSVFFAFWYSALITLSLFLFDVVAALLCRLIPKSKINIHSKIFKTFKFERGFYEKLGIRWWKEKIPELGGKLEGFSKSNIQSDSLEYFEMFIKLSITGEITHHICILLGILTFFIFPNYILTFTLPLFLVNVYFNILPVFVQRYNRPKLYKVYLRKTKQNEEKPLWKI